MKPKKIIPHIKKSALFLAVVSATAIAQEQRDIEEVIVTAERRQSTLQDTAVAITAIPQAQLSESDLLDAADLTGFAPSLVVSGQEDQSDIKIFIRGVGTNNPTETGDQGVGVYIDGVYAARAQGALALLYDLENLQVLRGPQGTLFGRNNTGGALLLTTVKPGSEFEGNVSLTYGNYNRLQVSGAVTLPVHETLSFRLAGITNKDDGWVNSLSTDPRGSDTNFSGITTGRSANVGLKLNNSDVRSARITSLFTPQDNLSWQLSYETFTDNGNQGILLNPVEVEKGNFQAFIDSPIALDMTSDVWRSTLSYDWNENINVEYIFGTSKLHRSQVVDQDAGITSRFQEGRTEFQNSDAASHELKFQSIYDGRFQWTAGWYYFEEETAIRFDFDGQGSWLQGGATFIQPARGAESQALYAQGTFQATDQLALTAGVRYTDDLKYDRGGRNIQDCNNEFIRPTLGGANLSVFEDFFDNRNGAETPDGLDDNTGLERTRNQCRATGRNDVEREDDQTTYFTRASYELGEHLLYASIGTGYRAGVIQDGGESTNPENSRSYEIGSKSDFGNMRLNVSAFFIDYTDLIRSGFDEDRQQVVNSNVAAAEITGLEVEYLWYVGETGKFEVAGSWLDAVYTDYIVDSPGSGTNNPPVLDQNGQPTGLFSLNGNSLPQAPEIQFTAGFKWDFFTADGKWTPRIRLRYSDDVFFRDENENRTDVNNILNGVEQSGQVFGNPAGQESYTKVDLGVTYSPQSEDWSVDLFINNATDELTRSSTSIDNGTAAGLPGRYASPRTYGIRINTKF